MADPAVAAPSSSPSPAAPAPTPAPVSPAPVVASASTPPSPATTQTQTPPTATPASPIPDRPSWLPEKFWDATATTVKADDFTAHYNEIQTRIAADDLKRAALPADPAAYKAELPADFKPPAGVDFKFNDADPLLAQARTVAHELGIPQEGFSKLLGLYAGAQVSQASTVETARLAEISKLGPTATARIDAIERFFDGYLGEQGAGKAITSRLFTAADVGRFEKLISRASSGASAFTGGSREPPPAAGKKTDAEIQAMSPAARLDYARQFSTASKGGRAA